MEWSYARFLGPCAWTSFDWSCTTFPGDFLLSCGRVGPSRAKRRSSYEGWARRRSSLEGRARRSPPAGLGQGGILGRVMGHFQLAGPSWAVVPGLTLVVLAILSGVETRWLDLDGRFRVRYFYLHHAPSEVPNTQREHLKPTWHATWHHGGKYLQKAPCTILSSAFVPSSLPLRSLSLSP